MSQKRNLTQWLHDGLHSLGARLQTREGRIKIVGGCFGLLRRLLRWASVAYTIALLLTCLLLRYIGEQNVFFAFCIYLPPLLWHLPAFMLLPACALVVEWRGLLLGIAGVCVSIHFFFGYEMPWQGDVMAKSGENQEHQLVVLTNNRGQNAGQSMRAFKNEVAPDVMVFQEAAGYSVRYLGDPGYAEFKHGLYTGEFSLVSKYPIVSAEPVSVKVIAISSSPVPLATVVGTEESVIVAGRFVIDFHGKKVVIYNVHLPSPRGTLSYHMRGAFLYGLIGIPGTSFGEKRAAIQRGWDQRTEMLRALLKLADKEVDPTILAGDFNLPSVGYCHGLVSDHWRDAHEDGGSGFGFTFPGTSRNPLWLGGPGLRIDYVFFDPKHWTCAGSRAEPDRESQHRASVARLILSK